MKSFVKVLGRLISFVKHMGKASVRNQKKFTRAYDLYILYLFLFGAEVLSAQTTTCPTPPKKYSLDTIRSVEQYTEVFSSRKLIDEHYCYTVISNVNVVDVEQGKTLPGMFVVLDHEKIWKITNNKDSIPKFPKGKCVLHVEGSSKYLLPGLCDMHVHYGCNATERFNYLLNGVTTVRNVGGSTVHREEQFLLGSNKLIGPDLYTTTTAITKSNFKKIDSLIALPDWIYFNYFSQDKIDSVLKTINTSNHKISVDFHGEHPKQIFPPGTVFEQISEAGDLLASLNNPAYWFISRFYNPVNDNFRLVSTSYTDLVKKKINQFSIGTETGSSQTNFARSDKLVLKEMQFLESIGVPRIDVIRTATVNAGRMCYESSTLPFGLVKEGYRANLILLSADPLMNLENFRKITGLFSRGTWISGVDMAEMRKFLGLSE